MIEIELKLKVDKFDEPKNLVLSSEKSGVDVYYDTADYALLKTGNFLRNRNNKSVDFKLNLNDLSHTYCKEENFEYENFANSKKLQGIFEKIKLKYNSNFKSFEEFLKINNFCTLAVVDKKRKTYKLDDLTICYDDVKDVGKFVEIELDLPDGTIFDKDEKTKYMLDKFLQNVKVGKYQKVSIGYVELYLKEYNKEAYNLGLYKQD